MFVREMKEFLQQVTIDYIQTQMYLDELSKPYKALNLKDEREEALGITMEQF